MGRKGRWKQGLGVGVRRRGSERGEILRRGLQGRPTRRAWRRGPQAGGLWSMNLKLRGRGVCIKEVCCLYCSYFCIMSDLFHFGGSNFVFGRLDFITCRATCHLLGNFSTHVCMQTVCTRGRSDSVG